MRETDRQTGRQAGRQAGRQRQRQRQTDRQTDRQTETETERETDNEREREADRQADRIGQFITTTRVPSYTTKSGLFACHRFGKVSRAQQRQFYSPLQSVVSMVDCDAVCLPLLVYVHACDWPVLRCLVVRPLLALVTGLYGGVWLSDPCWPL